MSVFMSEGECINMWTCDMSVFMSEGECINMWTCDMSVFMSEGECINMWTCDMSVFMSEGECINMWTCDMSVLGEKEDAVDSLAASLELQSDNATARKLLVRTYLELRRPNDALLHVSQFPRDDGDSALLAYNVGLVFYDMKQDAKAARALKVALAADPTHAKTWYLLGLTRLRQENKESARGNLRKFLELQKTGREADNARKLLAALEAG